jgi:hypothetical protein
MSSGRRPKVGSTHDAARRVLRRVEDHELGPRAQPRAQLLEIEREVARLVQRQRNRGGPDPPDRRLVDGKARVGIDDLVARLAHRQDREEQEGLRAVADEHPLRRHLDAAGARQLLGDGRPEAGQAGARAVVRRACPHGGEGRLRDVLGCREVRLADLQMDDVPALRFELARPGQDGERRLRSEAGDAGRELRRRRAAGWLPPSSVGCI